MRAWQPADMVGVTGLEYFDSTQLVTTADYQGTQRVATWTAIRPNGGPASVATGAVRDYRPDLRSVNGKQSVYFDTGFRQLVLPTENLPVAGADRFWFFASRILEKRAGDFYPWGYGGLDGSAVSWKTRNGAVPYSDIGWRGYAIGNTPIDNLAGGITIIVEAYREQSRATRAWHNGQRDATIFVDPRPTHVRDGARMGYWPIYGSHAEQHMLRLGYGYGSPTDADLRRLEAWLSWDTGDNGASLAADHAWRASPPIVADPIGARAAATLFPVRSTSAASLRVAAAAAASLKPVDARSTAGARITARADRAIGAAAAGAAGSLGIGARGTAGPAAIIGATASRSPITMAGVASLSRFGGATVARAEIRSAMAAALVPALGSGRGGLRLDGGAASALERVTAHGLLTLTRRLAPIVIPPHHRFIVPARPRAFVIRRGTSMSTITKRPAEERQYQADWTADLGGQTIAGRIAARTSDPALIVDRVEHDGKVMTFWLNGGRAGTLVKVEFIASTTGGEDLAWQQTVVCI